ncbi:MAG: 30S ribosomal protein S6 [Planctomycetota bacterium]
MTQITTKPQTHLHQAMFLLDNQEVRARGFLATRDWVRNLLEKHGIKAHVLRLWGERRLAYPIRQRHRATFLLGWLEASGEAIGAVKRELYLVGPVFRTLFLRVEEIPEEELAVGIEDVDESLLKIPEDTAEEPGMPPEGGGNADSEAVTEPQAAGSPSNEGPGAEDPAAETTPKDAPEEEARKEKVTIPVEEDPTRGS